MSIWERIRQAWKRIRAVFHTVNMLLGERIRELREAKSLSQRELEQRSGLLSCYIERVEHGHTVPSLETLERLAGRSMFRCIGSSMMRVTLMPSNSNISRV